jgi:hypothetical protein
VPVDDVVALEWSLEGDELYLMTATAEVFAVPLDRSAGRPRVGEATKLFDLPEAPDALRFAVGAGGEHLTFVVDPEARYQTLSVLLNWPARLERP